MGSEKVFLFGKWRKTYFDKGGEYIFMPTSRKFTGRSRGTKMYIKEILKSLG